MKGPEILKMISQKDDGIPIANFKNDFSPLKLMTILKPLCDLNFIEIDWKTGLIHSKIEPKDIPTHAYRNKVQITKLTPETPSYMRAEKIKKNKPTMPK